MAAAFPLMAMARGQAAYQKLLTLLRVRRDRRPRSAVTARGLWIAAVVLVVAACGQAQGNPSAAVGSPSPTSQTSPSPLLFAVLQAGGTATAETYDTVAIVGLDGHSIATTTFAPMPVPATGCMGPILQQSAHVAADKVFYADAKGVIRSLAINGAIATVTTFPMTSSQQMLSFAVSPDGTRLLGTVFTVPTNAWPCDGSTSSANYTFDTYAATSGQPSRLVDHQMWTRPQNALALTGWDAVGPIGTYPTVWASQGGGPGSTLGVAVRVDAATIKPLAPLADPSKCRVWNSIQSGAFVCMGDAVVTAGGTADQRINTPVSVRNPDGTELWHSMVTGQNGSFGPSLAPDGQHVMICCNDLNLADSRELLIARDGSQVSLAKGFSAGGWLDSTTSIGALDSMLAYVSSSTPGTAVSMGFWGLFIGTVRA